MRSCSLYPPIVVGLGGLDTLGHTNNLGYFRYLAMAHEFYWSVVFASRRRVRDDLILARAELDYRGQANKDHDLRVGIRASRIGNATFDFSYKILQDHTERFIGEGNSVQVMFDYPSNQPIELPDSVRTAILEFEGKDNVSFGRAE